MPASLSPGILRHQLGRKSSSSKSSFAIPNSICCDNDLAASSDEVELQAYSKVLLKVDIAGIDSGGETERNCPMANHGKDDQILISGNWSMCLITVW